MGRYVELSTFATQFAAEFKGYMRTRDINAYEIAERLGRSEAYVSERLGGKRPLSVEDVDVLARLSGDADGSYLMIELARRTRDNLSGGDARARGTVEI